MEELPESSSLLFASLCTGAVAVRRSDGGGSARRRSAGEQDRRQAAQGGPGSADGQEATTRRWPSQGGAGRGRGEDGRTTTTSSKSCCLQIYAAEAGHGRCHSGARQHGRAIAIRDAGAAEDLWLKNIAQYYFQQKDYTKALDAADQAVKHGVNDADTVGLIAKAQYLTGKYKEAAATMQEVVAKQDKPDEESLKLLWQCRPESR